MPGQAPVVKPETGVGLPPFQQIPPHIRHVIHLDDFPAVFVQEVEAIHGAAEFVAPGLVVGQAFARFDVGFCFLTVVDLKMIGAVVAAQGFCLQVGQGVGRVEQGAFHVQLRGGVPGLHQKTTEQNDFFHG